MGPVDFRSLSVREFGTIYEGLLESELAVADANLALKRQGKDFVYVPAKAKDAVAVPHDAIYLHNRSGARKSSGSYFTPGFAVDHLLDAALEPALKAHAERLATLDQPRQRRRSSTSVSRTSPWAAGIFWWRRWIGSSGRFPPFSRPKAQTAGSDGELATLRAAAQTELKKLGLEGTQQIEDGQLLRRLIARRCIYGVDLNPLAVDLARLSIWIHSFVPGLPLFLLDHSLVHGNALVGVATIGQRGDRFTASGMRSFRGRPEPARRCGGATEAPCADSGRHAARISRQARDAMKLARLGR